MRVARPSSMVINTEQASGQSCGQAAWTVLEAFGIWQLALGQITLRDLDIIPRVTSLVARAGA